MRLIETLHDVLGVLRLDAGCQHAAHFAVCAARAEDLLSAGFTQDELTELSVSIGHAYGGVHGGSGTFAEYRPRANLPGAENFDTFRRVLFERALEL